MIVISAGAFRAGSAWYFNMTNDLLIAAGKHDVRQIRDQYHLHNIMEGPNCNIGVMFYQKLLRFSSLHLRRKSFVVKTHANPTRGLRVLTALGVFQSTYIYRDPRDRIVSLLDIGKALREKGVGQRSGFDKVQTFEDALYWVRGARKQYDLWRQLPSTLVMRFEDLTLHTVPEMKRLSDFLGLGLTYEQVQSVLQKYLNEQVLVTEQSRTHYRRGNKVGRFKEVLTPEQIERCHDYLDDDLRAMGYLG